MITGNTLFIIGFIIELVGFILYAKEEWQAIEDRINLSHKPIINKIWYFYTNYHLQKYAITLIIFGLMFQLVGMMIGELSFF